MGPSLPDESPATDDSEYSLLEAEPDLVKSLMCTIEELHHAVHTLRDMPGNRSIADAKFVLCTLQLICSCQLFERLCHTHSIYTMGFEDIFNVDYYNIFYEVSYEISNNLTKPEGGFLTDHSVSMFVNLLRWAVVEDRLTVKEAGSTTEDNPDSAFVYLLLKDAYILIDGITILIRICFEEVCIDIENDISVLEEREYHESGFSLYETDYVDADFDIYGYGDLDDLVLEPDEDIRDELAQELASDPVYWTDDEIVMDTYDLREVDYYSQEEDLVLDTDIRYESDQEWAEGDTFWQRLIRVEYQEPEEYLPSPNRLDEENLDRCPAN